MNFQKCHLVKLFIYQYYYCMPNIIGTWFPPQWLVSRPYIGPTRIPLTHTIHIYALNGRKNQWVRLGTLSYLFAFVARVHLRLRNHVQLHMYVNMYKCTNVHLTYLHSNPFWHVHAPNIHDGQYTHELAFEFPLIAAHLHVWKLNLLTRNWSQCICLFLIRSFTPSQTYPYCRLMHWSLSHKLVGIHADKHAGAIQRIQRKTII